MSYADSGSKECPNCAFPLDKNDFCQRCQEKPSFPPRRGIGWRKRDEEDLFFSVSAPSTTAAAKRPVQ